MFVELIQLIFFCVRILINTDLEYLLNSKNRSVLTKRINRLFLEYERELGKQPFFNKKHEEKVMRGKYADFDRWIPFIRKINFIEETMLGDYYFSMVIMPDDSVISLEKEDITYFHSVGVSKKSDILNKIRKLNIANWKRRYELFLAPTDGIDWSLEFECLNRSQEYKKFKFGGYNVFPDNFDDMLTTLKIKPFHSERYTFKSLDEFKELVEIGYELQFVLRGTCWLVEPSDYGIDSRHLCIACDPEKEDFLVEFKDTEEFLNYKINGKQIRDQWEDITDWQY